MRFLTKADIDKDVIADLESEVYKELRVEKCAEHEVRCFGKPRALIDHQTRFAEYPFALRCVKKFGRVFDVGADSRFSVGIANRCDHLTIHYTHQNTCHMGLLGLPGELCSLHDWVYRNRHKVSLVNQTPPVNVVERHSYDVVFCLSVLEHVEPENLSIWEHFLCELVKPGGILVVTCDWCLDKDIPGEIHNQDYGLFQVPDKVPDDALMLQLKWTRLAVFGGVIQF